MSDAASPAPGQTLGEFVLEARVGGDAADGRFRARRPADNVLAALHVLDGAQATATSLAAFQREADALAGLDHPHIPRLVARGRVGHLSYVAVPWLEGARPLSARLHDGVAVAEALEIGQALCRALEHAHARNVVHGDVRADRVEVGGGSIRLSGFGSVATAGDAAADAAALRALLLDLLERVQVLPAERTELKLLLEQLRADPTHDVSVLRTRLASAAARLAQPATARDTVLGTVVVGVPAESRGEHAGTRPSPAGAIAGAFAPRSFGKYRLEAPLGQGGMGMVFRAWDEELRRPVALKVMRGDGDSDGAALTRFLREARAMARLRHPGIVAVHEVGQVDGTPFFTMDLVEGGDVDDLLHAGPLASRRALEIVRDAARAVQHAHDHGIVHRDLKPSNLLLTRDGHVVLTDFGLARDISGDATQLSLTGEVMGTPAYMPPEQARGERAKIGAPCDIYSLGAVLFHLLTGRTPFPGDSAVDILLAMLTQETPSVRRLDPRLDPDLDTLCLTAMAPEPERRYRTAGALADDCERCLAGDPIEARPPSLLLRWSRRVARRKAVFATAGAGILTLALFLGWLLPMLLESRARLAVRERLRPLEAAIQEARPFFYIPGDDVLTRLHTVEAVLGELTALESESWARTDAEFWITLGSGWVFVGDGVRAEHALRRAEALAPGDGRVSYLLGRLLLERALLDLQTGDLEQIGIRRERIRPMMKEAADLLARPWRGWSGAREIDRLAMQGFSALAQGDVERTLKIADEGLGAFREGVGTEEFWTLKGLALTGPEQSAAMDKALTRKPHDPLALCVRGWQRMQAGNLAGARTDFDWALHLNPHFLGAWINRAALNKRERAWDAAEADYSRAIELAPKSPAGWASRAALRLDRGQFADALADSEQAVALDPLLALALLNRAGARAGLGDPTGARQDYDRAIEIAPTYAAGYRNRALLRLHQGDVPGALADCDTALRLRKDFASAYTTRAEAHGKAGNQAAALSDWNAALALRPDDADARYNRGGLHLQLGHLREALADLEEAVRLEPRNAGSISRRGSIKLALRDVTGALADFGAALELSPDFAVARTNRAIILARQGDVRGAREDLDRAIRDLPTHAQAWSTRGWLRHEQGDLDGAITDYGEAIRLQPQDATNWFNRGNAHYARKQFDAAIADYDAVLSREERNANAWAGRGNARGGKKDFAGQRADFERALEVAPPEWAPRAQVQAMVEKMKAAGIGEKK